MPPPPSLAASAEAEAVTEPVRPQVPTAVDRTVAGIGFILASTIFFSLGDIAAKAMTGEMHPLQVTWFRYVVFCLAVVPIVLIVRGPSGLATRRPTIQILRGLATSAAAAAFILGLGHLPVADNTAINYLSPLFITALSIPLLGEKVGVRRWSAAFVGFLGVLLVVRPGSEAFQLAAFYPVCAALIWAFGAIMTRQMADEKPETTLAWTGMAGFVALALVQPFVWSSPSSEMLVYGLLTGLGSTIGHGFVVLAFARATASTLAPFTYVQLLFAAFFAYLAFGDVPGFSTIAGGLLIAGSGVYTAHRERVRRAAANGVIRQP